MREHAYSGFLIRPDPWQSRHERRTHSAWPLVMVPTTHARRERWNFHPWPRHAGQLSNWALVLCMPATVHDVSLRTNYTWGSQVRWIT